MEEIIVYTDGGCRGNGKENNVGAWGYIMKYKNHTKEEAKAVKSTTNNQCEMLAIIKALESINNKNIPVKIYSDSAYCVNGITSWIKGWKTKGWINSKKQPVENKELWQLMDFRRNEFTSTVEFIKVKGHTGLDDGNNSVDLLVNEAMNSEDGYILRRNKTK